MVVKEFSDQDLVDFLHFADLGETGDFLADKVVLDEIESCFNRIQVPGMLLTGTSNKRGILKITLDNRIDIHSLSAGQLFQAGWDEWQLELD